MKRIVAFLLCVLLLGSFVGEVPPVRAAETDIQIAGYSVQGVLGVADVYAVTLNLEWPAHETTQLDKNKLTLSNTDDHFKPATKNGNRYTISDNLPVPEDIVNKLNSGKGASYTFYFIMTGTANKLQLAFSNDGSSVGSSEILVIKTAPDPPPPYVPEPDPDPGPPVDTTRYKPNLTVDTEADMPLLGQDTEKLAIPIKNTAIYAANRITVAIEPADKSTPLFTANRITVSTDINTLSRDQVKNAEFDVALAPGATTGIHQVTINYIYHNNHGDRFTDSETAYIRVENSNAAPRLTATSSQTLTPGQSSQTRFRITNSGTTAARNVQVSLEGLDPSGVSVINDVDTKYIDLIEGGGSADVTFNLLAAGELSGASAKLQVSVDYTDTSGATYSSGNAVFLRLHGAVVGTDQGVPRLIISKHSFTPREIRAGSTFFLDLELQNTSNSKTITNLKVTISSDEGAFLPVDSSNTFFVERIAAGETTQLGLMLSAKADAENKAYPLHINCEYEDNQGASHSSQEMITIPVYQNSRLVVGDIEFYGEPMLFNMVPANVEFYNLGKTILYNLMVTAEGPFQLEGGTYFVGNFNPGSSDAFGFAITPTEPGEQIGEIVFQFEDSIGTPHEVRRELRLNVMEPFVPDVPWDEFPPPVAAPSKWKYIGIGAGVLLVVAAGLFLWLRRRKKQRIELQQAQDYTAATQAVVPEIEYVGFEEEDQPDKSEPNS